MLVSGRGLGCGGGLWEGDGAEGHANADFAGLQADEVGHYAVDADQGQEETQGGEDSQEESLGAGGGVYFGYALVEGCDGGDGLVFVDGPDAVLEGGD